MAVLFDAEGNEVQVPDDVLGTQPDPNDPGSGPKGLRTHAKTLETDLKAEREARAADLAKLAAYERRDKFSALAAEHKIEGLTVEDLGDIAPDDITPTLLRVKAEEKAQAAIAALSSQATAAGFLNADGTPDVEGFKTAVEEAKAARAANTAAQAAGAQAARAGAPATPPSAKTPEQLAEEAFVEARKANKPLDAARADYISTMLAPPVQTPGT